MGTETLISSLTKFASIEIRKTATCQYLRNTFIS